MARRQRTGLFVGTVVALSGSVLLWSQTATPRISEPETSSFSADVEDVAPSRESQFLLSKIPITYGARCMDGSEPSFYFRQGIGAGTDRWLIKLEGGGWCTTQKECYEWVKDGATEAGSDTLSNTTTMSGIHSIDPEINPMFFQWNQIFVNYCDGGSYMGDLDEPYWYDGVQVHIKGSRIVPAVLTYLNDNFQFHAATDVLFCGESSGALGAMLNANKAGEFVKRYTGGIAEFRVLSDAGWFLDIPNYENGNYTSQWFKHIVEMRNMTAQFDKSCRNSMSENHIWKCFLPYYNFPHIEAPVFLIQSDLDIYQLETFYYNDVEAGVQCVENPMVNCTPDLFAATDRFRAMFQKHMDLPRKTPSTGIFLDSCFAHVQTKSNNHWNTPLLQGVTMAEAIQHWYFQGKVVNVPKTYKYEDKQPWPHVHQSCDAPINFKAWYDMDLKQGLWDNDKYTNQSGPPPQVMASDPSVRR